ncbi:complement component C6 isoform X1 [Tachyglossus aculeatus]|uniref:complement component C6 isoform X1 n=1 Tax=Tachyglossus aculeatus TaxID=9261 RepID=UPI0018F75309|nr:complement component C6 isoform X1 [Tachyglossus aculeatus]
MGKDGILFFVLLSVLPGSIQACLCERYPWSAWSSCSKSCNYGTQSRHRHIVMDEYFKKNFCDQLCAKQESKACNEEMCPINCQLGDFGPWSDCDPCVKKQFQARSLLRPSQFGGQACEELLVKSQKCYPTKICNIEELDCKNKFKCDSGRCIAKKLECNGENDCGDNSDERDCAKKSRVCGRVYHPVPSVQIMGMGFHLLAGEPRGEVLDNAFTGGKCTTVKSSRGSNPYRVPANVETIHFQVETQEDDLQSEFYHDLTPLKSGHSSDISSQASGGGSSGIPYLWSTKRKTQITNSASFKQAIQASHEKDSSFIRVHKVISVLNFTMKEQDLQLSDVFLKSLSHLPLEYNYALYSRIFDDFGTHYFTTGSLGGTYDLLYQYSREDLKNSGLTEEEAVECVRTETTKRRFFFKTKKVHFRCVSNQMSERYEGSFTQVAEKSLSLVQGGRSEYAAALAWEKGASLPEESIFTNWLESVKENPAVVGFELTSILDLVKGIPCAATRRNNLKKALGEYAEKFDPCRCAPCPNNGRPVLSGTECMCVCQSGTYGQNCEKRARDFTSNTVDGLWSCWSPWSACDGSYRRRRTRRCDNPAPLNGGKTCEGDGQQEEDCSFSIFVKKGALCLNDDKDIKEVDIEETEPTEGCRKPLPPANGFIRNEKRTYSVGEDAEIVCMTGFEAVGFQYVSCLPDKTWKEEGTECRRATCSKPSVPEGLSVSPHKKQYQVGDSILLVCPPGFVITGLKKHTCGKELTWEPPVSSSISCEQGASASRRDGCAPGRKAEGSKCICMSPTEDCGSRDSEDLCVFDTSSSRYTTKASCQFLAERCRNEQQIHFLLPGPCEEGPQLQWALERTKLSLKSTKKEPCGYNTCYDWERCSDAVSVCSCLIPSQCPKDGSPVFCIQAGSAKRKRSLNLCELGALKCAQMEVEELPLEQCLL